MADKKISQLTAASTPLAGTEVLPIVQSGQTVKATAQDVANLALPYKVYTALLTQSGGSSIVDINWDDDPREVLVVGITYEILDNSGGADFTNIGAPNNNNGTQFVATGITPTSWGTGALRYNAGAPVVTVLENTIGNIWFTYDSVGNYSVYSNGLFVTNKTTFHINLMGDDFVGNECLGYMQEPNSLGIITGTNGTLADGALTWSTPIEIRVYN